MPQILIFYNIENGEKAFTAAEFGGIGINEFYLFKKIEPKPKYICYDKDISLIDESKDDEVAMDIAIYLIHESFGHKCLLLLKMEFNLQKKWLVAKTN